MARMYAEIIRVKGSWLTIGIIPVEVTKIMPSCRFSCSMYLKVLRPLSHEPSISNVPTSFSTALNFTNIRLYCSSFTYPLDQALFLHIGPS